METALSMIGMIIILFGIIEISLGIYGYHYMSEAARAAIRYTIVRGSNSCISSSNGLSNCNILPNDTTYPIQAYVRSLAFPGIDTTKITVTATWYVATYNQTTKQTTWTTKCPGATDANGYPCNNPGNKVTVEVDYPSPLSIPFSSLTSFDVKSTATGIIMN